MKEYYTYAYLREDKTPYYIGKGKKDRVYNISGRIVLPPKDKSRIIFLKQNLTEEEAFTHEIYMIDVFGRVDLGTGILHNRTNGGDGTSGVVPGEETRKKLGMVWKGRKHTEETKIKMSEVAKGKPKSEETKKKISESKKNPSEETRKKLSKINKGKNLSEEQKRKISKSCMGKNKGFLNGNYGKHWYTDGTKNIMSFECPDGFYKGKTKN
jgi:hypothetical protein